MLTWDEFPDNLSRERKKKKPSQSDKAIKESRAKSLKEKRGQMKNGATSSCSLLPLINESSSSRIYLCNTCGFIACLCTPKPSDASLRIHRLLA